MATAADESRGKSQTRCRTNRTISTEATTMARRILAQARATVVQSRHGPVESGLEVPVRRLF